MLASQSLPLGDLDICVHMLGPTADEDLDRMLRPLTVSARRFGRETWHLFIVMPTSPQELRRGLPHLPANSPSIVVRVYEMWKFLCQNNLALTMTESTFSSLPWVDPWDELITDMGLLRYESGGKQLFFALVTPNEGTTLLNRMTRTLFFLSAWWHTMHGSLLLHGAAIAYDGAGCLFLGRGGAGKSTVASMSASVGLPVLSDDLAFVLGTEDSDFVLAAAPGLLSTLTTAPSLRPPLRGIFLLTQDREDQLVPLSKTETAQAILESFLWNYWTNSLPPRVTKSAFFVSCDIARKVPGYKLHFRKSMDFWKLIDEQLSGGDTRSSRSW